MNTDDRAVSCNCSERQRSRMQCARLVLLTAAAFAFSVFSLSSAVPLLASPPQSPSDSGADDRSLKLVAKNPAYWRGLEIEDGTVPAWVGRDGLMRVPRAFGGAPFSPASASEPGALSDLIDRDYGVVFPPASGARSPRSHDDSERRPDSAVKEFVASFRQSHAWNEYSSPRSTSTSMCAPSASTCRECYRGYLSPTPTNQDGSDIFRHDLYDPSHSYPPAFNYSEESLIPECSYQDEPPGYLVCSDAGLTEVPRLPREKLSIFQLNDTAVTTLRRGGFDGADVVVMKLDSNSIATIEPGAFAGISNLLTLSLDNNQITTVEWSMFAGLDKLVVLSLRNNEISLNDSGSAVPPHHANNTSPLLSGLAYLNLANNPLGQLNKYVFWDLADSSIEDLNLKSCDISFIHEDAFVPLKRLIHIDLFNNPMLIHSRDQLALKFSSQLLQLGLGANRLLQTVPTPLFSNAAATLNTLNLSGNLFFFVTNALFPTNSMPNLATLILESCSVSFVEDAAFGNLPNLTTLYLGKNQLNKIAPSALPARLTLLSLTRNQQRSDTHFSLTDDNLAHLKQLLWLDMSYMDLGEMTANVFNGLSRLLILQVRGSGLANIPGGLFAPLRNLLVLDLGDNTMLQTLPRDFSVGLGGTKMLFLDHCNLDFSTSGEENATSLNDSGGGALEPYQPFSEMKALESLYLHNNNIRHFPPSIVANLTRLYVLYLRGNLLQTWESGITAYMPRDEMTAVDASNNRITILPNRTYEEFAHINAIDLSDNALTCNCETYDLKRLAEEDNNTTVCYWDKPFAYTCTESAVKDAPVIKEIPEMGESEFHCPSPVYTAYAIGTAVFLGILLIVVVSVCYYKRVAIYRRWFVYWHGRTAIDRADGKRRKSPDENGNQFEYDAFISFNENDRPWVYTQLVPNLERNKASSTLPDNTPSFRLCLHDRDFTAGQRITENIVDNISKSRKVVIVLSRSYVDSKWCQFELHLSQHRLLESERRDDLILVILEDVPKQQLNVGLRYFMRTRTYLAWRNDIEGQRTFWKRLRQDLMDGYSETLDSSQTGNTENVHSN